MHSLSREHNGADHGVNQVGIATEDNTCVVRVVDDAELVDQRRVRDKSGGRAACGRDGRSGDMGAGAGEGVSACVLMNSTLVRYTVSK